MGATDDGPLKVGLVIDAGVVMVEEFFRVGNRTSVAVANCRSPILFAAATTAGIFLPLLLIRGLIKF